MHAWRGTPKSKRGQRPLKHELQVGFGDLSPAGVAQETKICSDMLLDEFARDGIQGSDNCLDLLQFITAVASCFDHNANTAYLPLNSV